MSTTRYLFLRFLTNSVGEIILNFKLFLLCHGNIISLCDAKLGKCQKSTQYGVFCRPLQNTSPSPKFEILIEDLETSEFDPEFDQHRIPPPPRNGAFREGLRDFRSDLTQNTRPAKKNWNFSCRTLHRGLVCGD